MPKIRLCISRWRRAHAGDGKAGRDTDDDTRGDQTDFTSPRKGTHATEVEKQREIAEAAQVEFGYHRAARHHLDIQSLRRPCGKRAWHSRLSNKREVL
jgi:hypothetical protein